LFKPSRCRSHAAELSDYEVRVGSTGYVPFFCRPFSFLFELPWELPSSEPPVGRSPGTRAASLAADRRRRRKATDAFVGELRGKRLHKATGQTVRRMRLFEVSTLPGWALASSHHSFRIKPCWFDHRRPPSLGRFSRLPKGTGGSAEFVWSRRLRFGLTCCFAWRVSSSPARDGWGLFKSLFQKAAGRIR
jgi:hypothetical protein